MKMHSDCLSITILNLKNILHAAFYIWQKIVSATENTYTKEIYLKIEVSEEFHFIITSVPKTSKMLA